MKLKFKHKFAASLLQLIAKSWRIKINGILPDTKGIIVFWHGMMLPGWYICRNLKPIGVVSTSKDGEILSHLLTKWGFELIRGSSSKGGKEVLNEIVSKASNRIIVMTPDGPRGPIYKFKAGAVVAAHRSNVSIYLCRIKITKNIVFNKSWDNFNLPLPFSSIVVEVINKGKIPENSGKNEINSYIDSFEKELI